jgi:hypothetical protein
VTYNSCSLASCGTSRSRFLKPIPGLPHSPSASCAPPCAPTQKNCDTLSRAIVGGSRAVALSCVDPEPKFPLLTEQAALVSYLTAIGKCNCHTFSLRVRASRADWQHRRVLERNCCAADAKRTFATHSFETSFSSRYLHIV